MNAPVNRVRAAREAMTQENGEPWRNEDLAVAIGRSKAFVSALENGLIVKPFRMRQVAEALNTTPEALWPDHYPSGGES